MNDNVALQLEEEKKKKKKGGVNIVFTTCTSEPQIHKFFQKKQKRGLKADYQRVKTIWLREERDWCLFFCHQSDCGVVVNDTELTTLQQHEKPQAFFKN